MTTERWIRFVAGALVLTGLMLGLMVSRYWFLLSAFVGAGLLQSALTQWCLLEDILTHLGAKRCRTGETVPDPAHPPAPRNDAST